MSHSEQPRDSDLELVVSLTGSDVDTIDDSLLQVVSSSWEQARDVVSKANQFLQAVYPAVPIEFFSYRLRKLVALGLVQAAGTVNRESNYRVRAGAHAPAA